MSQSKAISGDSTRRRADEPDPSDSSDPGSASDSAINPDMVCPQYTPNQCPGDPVPKTPTVPPSGPYSPWTPENANSSRARDTAGSNSLIVSQGATAYLDWACITSDPVTGATSFCPTNITSAWYSDFTPYFSIAFSPVTTTGAGTTYQVVTVPPTTPPGTYTIDVCLQASFSGSLVGGSCGYFEVTVISATQYNAPVPNANISLTTKLQIGAVGSVNLPGGISLGVPGAGHLYIQLYVNNIAETILEAGPSPTNLVPQQYFETVYSDPSADLTSVVSAQTLVSKYNVYGNYATSNDVPLYDKLGQTAPNSNTFIDGLMIAAGVTPTAASAFIIQVAASRGVQAPGYQYGNLLQNCFRPPPSRRLDKLPPVPYYTGCAAPVNSVHI